MSHTVSSMPFRLGVLKPNLFLNADQIAQRQDVPCRLPHDDLDVASGQIIHLLRRIKQALDDVGHWLLLTWAASVALRYAAYTIGLSAWFALSIAAAYWARFDAPIWVGLF